MTFFYPKLLLVSILSVTSIFAQEATEPKREVKGRVARFVCSGLPNGMENPVTISAGSDISELVLSKFSVSVAVKVPEDGIVKIVRKLANAADPSKPQYQTLCQTTIPENVNDALVILVPTKDNPKGLLFQSKVQDLSSFKPGESMFLNLTNFKIGLELGTNKLSIDPGKVQSLNPLGGAAQVSLPISVHYFDPAKKDWSRITASTVALYATRRELCIFVWDSTFNRVDYESVAVPSLEKP